MPVRLPIGHDMRCDCCNKLLTDSEATAKFAESKTYVSMCTKCRQFIPKDIPLILREDFSETEDDDEYYDEYYDGEEDYDDDE